MSARRAGDGFTIVEILVSLALTTMALAGTLGVYNAATAANRRGDQLARATRLGEEVMEELRGKPVSEISTMSQLGDVIVSGVTYHRPFTVADIGSKPNLALVTVTVSYGDDGDETDAGRHQLVLQSLRTKVETF